MKNRKKLITYTLLTSMALSMTGCNNNNNQNIITTETTQITTEVYNEEDMYKLATHESTTTEMQSTEKITEEKTTEEITTEERTIEEFPTEEITSEEIIIDSSTEETIVNSSTEEVTATDIQFDNFKADLEIIKQYVDKDDIDNLRKKGKEFFIKHIDFIFFGSEINGKTFNELNEESKQMTIENFKAADELIMKYAPDYKEDLSEKYQSFKNFSKEKYEDLMDYIKNKVGDEKYDEYEEKKDQILEKSSEVADELKDKAGETAEKAKEKVKSLYKDWKQK